MTDRTSEHHPLYDRFELLFLVTVVTVALLLLVDLDQDGGIVAMLSFLVTLLAAVTFYLAVAAAGVGRKGRRLALAVAGTSVITGVVSILFSDIPYAFGGILWLALVVTAPVFALRRLMQHRTVTAATLLGALSVYLLVALAATYLFLFIDTAFSGSARFFGQEQPTTVFAYFSLVTITTLGYGDFEPVERFGRSVAVWEAVIGQVYLVVVVARLVTLYSGRRELRGRTEEPSVD